MVATEFLAVLQKIFIALPRVVARRSADYIHILHEIPGRSALFCVRSSLNCNFTRKKYSYPMPNVKVTHQMPVESGQVFSLLHDYDRRLQWDTLLKEARLTGGCEVAEKDATAICVGKPLFGIFQMETQYVTFKPGEVAAVKLINKPPFFESFSASIRHRELPVGSELTYTLNFWFFPEFYGDEFEFSDCLL